jgi:hypothetical protein
MDLIDVYKIFHPTTAQYTFLSAACGTFSKIDCLPSFMCPPSPSESVLLCGTERLSHQSVHSKSSQVLRRESTERFVEMKKIRQRVDGSYGLNLRYPLKVMY